MSNLVHTAAPGLTGIVDDDRAGLVPYSVEADADGARGKKGIGAIGPLDERDTVAAHEVEQAEVHQLGEAAGAVGGHMVHGEPAAVLMDEEEGGAGGAGAHAEAAHEPLHQTRLAAAELAVERDDITGTKRATERLAGGRGLVRRGRAEAIGRHGAPRTPPAAP